MAMAEGVLGFSPRGRGSVVSVIVTEKSVRGPSKSLAGRKCSEC